MKEAELLMINMAYCSLFLFFLKRESLVLLLASFLRTLALTMTHWQFGKEHGTDF
jgi:hypothetical protein